MNGMDLMKTPVFGSLFSDEWPNPNPNPNTHPNPMDAILTRQFHFPSRGKRATIFESTVILL